MKQSCLVALAATLSLFIHSSESASAQTYVEGIEPNDTKATATLARDLLPGDVIYVRASSCQFTGPDFFRVAPAHQPSAIYQHRMTKTSPFVLDSIDLYGLDALADEVLPQSFSSLATSNSIDAAVETQFVSWYGFGKSEELYVEVGNTGSCRNGASAELSSTVVIPTSLGVVPFTGTPAFTSIFADGVGPAGPVDVELHLFDSEFNAIPAMWSDDAVGAVDARISGYLSEGTYYLAVSDAGVATHLPPGSATQEADLLHSVMDFAGAIVNGSAEVGFDVNLLIGAAGQTQMTFPKTEPFEILWFTFDVGTTQTSTSFCPGDGGVVPCPCGVNAPVGAGVGCPNSTGRGASIIAHRTSTFSSDLTLEDLPPQSAALTFLSLGTQAPSVVFGGLLCLDSSATRLPFTTTNAVGSSTFEFLVQDLPASFAGQTVYAQAAYRDSLSPPCNVNFTSGASFLLY